MLSIYLRPHGRPRRALPRRLAAVIVAAGLLALAPAAHAGTVGDACDTPPSGFNVIEGTTGNDLLDWDGW